LLLVSLLGGVVGVTWKWMEATDKAQEARFQAYRARIAAAVAALAVDDVADAARQLKETPEEQRDWEWRHLHSRRDDRGAMLLSPAGSQNPFRSGARDPPRAGAMPSPGRWLTDREGGEPRTLPLGPGRPRLVSATPPRRGLRVAVWVGGATFDLLDEAGR